MGIWEHLGPTHAEKRSGEGEKRRGDLEEREAVREI